MVQYVISVLDVEIQEFDLRIERMCEVVYSYWRILQLQMVMKI